MIFSGDDGARIPSGFFSALFAEYGYAIRRFSAVEVGVSRILLEIEKAPRYSESTLETIKGRIRERLGASLAIDVSVTEPAPAGSSPLAATTGIASVRNA